MYKVIFYTHDNKELKFSTPSIPFSLSYFTALYGVWCQLEYDTLKIRSQTEKSTEIFRNLLLLFCTMA